MMARKHKVKKRTHKEHHKKRVPPYMAITILLANGRVVKTLNEIFCRYHTISPEKSKILADGATGQVEG